MDYIVILGVLFPNVKASCYGDSTVYENLVWESGDPLPTKAELELAELERRKLCRIIELSKECERRIIEVGFVSDGLGTPYLYDSDIVDQINLIGSLESIRPTPENPAGGVTPYACRDVDNLAGGIRGPKTYRMHTYEQLSKVVKDGKDFKLELLIIFNARRDFILQNELTEEQLSQVTMDGVPTLP